MSGPRLTMLAEALPSSVPFVGPETQERALGRPFAARLGANESGFGPSPKAVAALATAASLAWRYGDPEAFDLRHALSRHLELPGDYIVIGEGIDGLLGLLVRLLVAPGDPVVTSDGAYPTFNYHVAGFGGVLHKVPYREDREDLGGLLAKVRETGARLVYLANPDNPMGTWHLAEAVASFADALPADCVLCLDEAYGEFAPDGVLPPLEPVRANVVRMRTFSKAYGLAGLRVGYAITAAPLAKAFDKVRNHFGTGGPAQAAAVAALADGAHLESVRENVATAKRRIVRIGAANGLRAVESATNFQTLDTGRDGDFARAVVAALAERGVFIRMPFVAPQDRCIRISCAPDAELDVFEGALPDALAATREQVA